MSVQWSFPVLRKVMQCLKRGLVVLVANPLLLLSQPFEQRVRPFPVLQAGDTLDNPFSGGLETPVHQFVDLDGDGDVDLVVLDRDGQLTTYTNAGSGSAPRFLLTSFNDTTISVGSWFRFVDIDGDGDPDLFCNGPGATVRFYRNQGSPTSPLFVKEVETLVDSSGNAIISEEISHPVFADIDGDGDMDFLSGNSAGTITYYENVGSPTEFLFKFITANFQDIVIIGPGGSREELHVPPAAVTGLGLHGAMALALGDLDNDGDLDMLWGDYFNPSLYLLRNEGTPFAPQFVLRDSTFSDEAPVMTNGFNMPSLVDIDADGDLDLFIGVLSIGSSRNNFHWYRNNGTVSEHQYELITTAFLPTIDLSATSAPVFVDLDGDGDEDLVVGGEDGTLALFEREGGGLRLVTEQLVATDGLFNIAPAFGDLNGDGRTDLLVGDFNGRLRLWLGSDSGFVSSIFQLDTVQFGLNAAPALADLNGDGLPDLFVGTGGGRIVYYRNAGSPTAPQFVHETSFFLSLDVGDDAKPAFVDLDGDGDLDLVIGAYDGSLRYFRNDGSSSDALFVEAPGVFSAVSGVLRSAPAFADMDGDGDPDLVLGNVKGGLYFYENRRLPVHIETSIVPPRSLLLQQNYPNPFNPQTAIEFYLPRADDIRLSVFDVLGREVAVLLTGRREAGLHQEIWEARGMPSGVYFCRLAMGSLHEIRRMVIVK